MYSLLDVLAAAVATLGLIVVVLGWLFTKYESAVGSKIVKKELRKAKFRLSDRQIHVIWLLAIALVFFALFYLMKRGHLHL